MPLPSIRSSNTQDVAASPWRVPAASDAAAHDLHVLGGLLACTNFSDSQWMKNNDLFPYGRCKDLIYILLYVLLGVEHEGRTRKALNGDPLTHLFCNERALDYKIGVLHAWMYQVFCFFIFRLCNS